MRTHIFRSHKEAIREKLSWNEAWLGEDKGLIQCWEVGRELAVKKPELAKQCVFGELPVLGWKGGVDKNVKDGSKLGTLKYLAQWQGLRGQNLDIHTNENTILSCTRTGISVTFSNKHETGSDTKPNLRVSAHMHLNRYTLKNFRRFECVEVNLDKSETIYVGANNAGKTSATEAFRLFINNRREFKIHDFPSRLITSIDEFGNSADIKNVALPSIEIELWFTINPETEYGRVAHFLPILSLENTEIGIKLAFSVNDKYELIKNYKEIYEVLSRDGEEKLLTQKLSYYLAQNENLKKHFSIKYFMLEKTSSGTTKEHLVDANEGKNTLKSLLRVDFVEAQRNIDDNSSVRSTRLSQVFYDFYQHNLEKHKSDTESLSIIEKSNNSLTAHYEKEFKSLISTISELGFPSLNDRKLKVISNLNPEKALSGNTALNYFDAETEHMLPESYNGLGFKNLIYMAIQVAHFQIQWFNTESSRPLCQLIFIEEPEAHLHAQVQQTFIRKIRAVIKKTNKDLGIDEHTPQLIVTTHSSHIVAESDFSAIRYFRRHHYSDAKNRDILSTSQILNLANFAEKHNQDDNLKFLKKYLSLTHCDLFFADATIIIEGTVERILMPGIIKNHFQSLENCYITTLELGGAFAHKFIDLIKFLNLPCLVITDIDSVDPNNNHNACIASQNLAVSSNTSIGTLLLGRKDKQSKAEKEIYNEKRKISNIIKLTPEKKKVSDANMYVTFQQPIDVVSYGKGVNMTPRTFEEAFIYTNIEKIRSGKIDALIPVETLSGTISDHELIYECVVSDFKKVEFALTLIASSERWEAPAYIKEGLEWLNAQLKPTA